MKKRTIVVVALAVVLALSFATIATAKYAGYGYNNQGAIAGSDNPTPGYLSWPGAQGIWGTDSKAAVLKGTAHGGYVSTTVKCAVCHSVHRAVSPEASTGTVDSTPGGDANKMLAMGNSCKACHTTWGAGNATKKVEWADTNTTSVVGPHATRGTAGDGCSACHTGGIHGGNSSEYHGMNIYMLGSEKDSALATAFAAGNALPAGTVTNWFASGSDSPTSIGSWPASISSAGNFAYAKATATGYTCAVSGCHVNSQFAVNTWGFSAMVASNPDTSTVLSPTTGHRTAPGATSNHVGQNCGPCHPGNGAGGYRYAAAEMSFSANAYGCDQCHDMVGKATNSTAWPHGNRGIAVYEWNESAAQTVVAEQPTGNLWMYQSSIVTTVTTSLAKPVDPSFTIINNSTSFNTAAGTAGKINDGVCLKCHVAVDAQSLTTNNIAADSRLYVGRGTSHGWNPASPTTTLPASSTSSTFIYLWR